MELYRLAKKMQKETYFELAQASLGLPGYVAAIICVSVAVWKIKNLRSVSEVDRSHRTEIDA